MHKLRRYFPAVMLLLLAVIFIGLNAQAAALPPIECESEVADGTCMPIQEDPLVAQKFAYYLKDYEPTHNLEAKALTPCVAGFAGSYPCSNVDLMAFMPLANIGGGQGNDIWGWTDPQTGKEYAIMGRTSGTSFIDISNPESPIYLGNLPTHTSSSTWRDIKVYNNHAFIVSEASGHGMQVFNLTQLRNVTNPPITFSSTAHYGSFGNAHNIAINEATGFAYAVGTSTCSGGLHMVNIQNPTSPTNAGCVSNDGYTHDTQCVIYNGPDTQHQGKEICFSSNEDTLTIINVTNKSTPVQLSRTGYTGSEYTHQGWLTENQHYFLLDDELDEQTNGHNTRTYIWNVQNLDAPTLIGFYNGATTAIDHNLYVKGNFAYESNYRAGLRIVDITNVSSGSLTEAGYFDVYPSSNSASFNGTWSNYPYFASGMVVVSGIEQGLFVLRPNLGPPPPTPTPSNTPPPSITPTPSNTPSPTNTPLPSFDVFFDNFESNLGWTVNPNGTDTATLGLWERGNPEDTNSSGPKQLGTTFSGSNDLVTGRLAGSSPGDHDIDSGLTSVRSPNIILPTSGPITLSFQYYLAHGTNSSSADYLRVSVVGSTTQQVFQELGAADDDDAVWALHTVDISSFAGQTVYLRVEAADTSTASLVEAAVDDVRITGPGGGPTATPTHTPPPTHTPTPSATPGGSGNTGFLPPSANAATSGGDGNGFQFNPANAYVADNLYARDANSGTNGNSSCTATQKDKHLYYNYNFNIPAGSTIDGIEVQLDARVDNTSGSPLMCVQLSWDGGVTWTAAQSTATLSTAEGTYILGGPANLWGRAWSVSEFSNSNFRVRLINVATSTARDFELDFIAVRVHY
jgi:choice-of-anchor B domain-containing protein